jgi:hypothetical protein
MRSILTLGFAAAALAACGGGEPALATSSVMLAASLAPGAGAHDSGLARHSLGGSSLSRIYLLGSAPGRARFARVVACALPRGLAITAIASDGTPYRFAGSVGRAPGWAERPATAGEQRQIARCLRAPSRLELRAEAADESHLALTGPVERDREVELE